MNGQSNGQSWAGARADEVFPSSLAGGVALGNQAVAEPLSAEQTTELVSLVSKNFEQLFDILGIDHCNDHNTRDTPRRVAKMLVLETLRGRYQRPPAITEFENVSKYDQLIVTGPIEVRSTCAHHLMPIYGRVYIGILPSPSGHIIGLSKYDRVVDHFSSRLQIQEELVRQIGDLCTRRRGEDSRGSPRPTHDCTYGRGERSRCAARSS